MLLMIKRDMECLRKRFCHGSQDGGGFHKAYALDERLKIIPGSGKEHDGIV